MSVDERLITLETRLSYQDRLLAALDEVVREQADKIVQLERQVRELRLAMAGGGGGGDGRDEPPPHY